MISKCKKCGNEALQAEVMTVETSIDGNAMLETVVLDGEYVFYGYLCPKCGELNTSVQVPKPLAPPKEEEKLFMPRANERFWGEDDNI